MYPLLKNLLVCLGLVSLSGCLSTSPAVSPRAHFSSLPGESVGQNSTSTKTAGQNSALIGSTRTGGYPTADAVRLEQLWHRRTQMAAAADYPLGPGDVLEISVPRMEEISARTVRVSGEGTIALPFVGVVNVNGMTESELKEELCQRLTKYKRKPEVSLFVREYRSRLVAVAGAVAKPGLYSVSSTKETILSVISQAGGMTKEALPQVLLLPVEAEGATPEARLASTEISLPSLSGEMLTGGATQQTDPLVIDLQRLRKGKQQLYLTLPVRPGDALIIPSGGEVVVGGWVDKPGSYKITPGLTVLGAVTAAGDTLFPADTKSVKVIRTSEDGQKTVVSANLQQIASGEHADIPLQEGDVIEVNPSTIKLVSYGMFHFFRSVFTVGTQLRPY